MASRFAVSTGNWSGAIWAATSGGVAGSAATPTSSDDATINSGVTVTIDSTAPVCLSLSVTGTLIPHASNDGKITVQNGITVNSGGYLNFDMTAAYTPRMDFVINNAGGAAADYFTVSDGGKYNLKGYVKKRWTTLTASMSIGATSCTVADSTGWQTGDKLVFGTTQAYNATPRIDVRDTTGSATAWASGTTYAHSSGGLVGNFSSNLTIGGPSATTAWRALLGNFATASGNRIMTDVLINGGTGRFRLDGGFAGRSATATNYWGSHSNNAFYDIRDQAFNYFRLYQPVTRSDNICYAPSSSSSLFSLGGNVGNIGAEINGKVFAGNASGASVIGFDLGLSGKLQGCTVSQCFVGTTTGTMEDCDIYSNVSGIYGFSNVISAETCRIGTQFSGAATNSTGVLGEAFYKIDLLDTQVQSSNSVGSTLFGNTGSYVAFTNKNADVTSQEKTTVDGFLSRSNSEIKRSTSSVAIKPLRVATDVPYEFSVPCANGASIRIIGYCKADTTFYNGGGSNWTAPTVTISGLGITPQVFTASSSANNAFEKFDLTATNSSGADGNLTVTFNANAKSVLNGTVYFDGVATSPYVTKARHYGFTFDEGNPSRTVNGAISASESTAAAYTGISVTGGTSASPVTLSADQTFQKLYDYTQVWSCGGNSGGTTTQLTYAVPLTGAGVAGSVSLFAAANVTTTGYTLNGGGSLNIGSYTLTASVPFTYTYTGGTFSQASTVPGFNGGTLNIGSTGTYTFDTSGTVIVSMTPAGSGTYAMSGVTASGTLDLRNTTAHAITVELESGITYTTANNTGGTITVSTPQVYQSVVVSNLTAGTRVQIYDTTSSTELANATSTGGDIVFSSGGTVATWTDPTPASASRAIRVRLAYVSGATAKTFVEASVGTCGTTDADKTVSYLANQVNDTVYNNNAITGSGVTGVTFTDSSPDVVNIDVAANTISWKTIYAAWVYYAFTSTGIATDIDYIQGVDEANYILSNMKIKNTSSPSEPLEVTGGYGRDATTGAAIDLVDTTGGTLVFAPDHVVSYAVGSGVTAGDVTDIAAAVLTAASSAPIHANIKKVADTTVTGSGTAANPWGP